VKAEPKYHHYSLSIIRVVVMAKLQTSASFRAIGSLLVILRMHVDVLTETPSHSTIANWVYKVGYYELHRPQEQADDWIIILDHSIQLGQDKLFVVYGIREEKIDFSRPLRYGDLNSFVLTSKTKWTSQHVCDSLQELQHHIGAIKYAVGDYSGELKKGLELASIRQIHDLTHAMALMIEKLYKQDTTYQSFTCRMSAMRVKYSQSQLAALIPPKQRKKSRYHNIKTISDWATKALQALLAVEGRSDDDAKRLEDALQWLRPYRKWIAELNVINDVISQIERIVKRGGLSRRTVIRCRPLLSKLISHSSVSGVLLKREIEHYFFSTLKLIGESQQLVCTSDILESAFGKYKNYLSKNPMTGVTKLALVIAAFTSSLEDNDIRHALETTRMKDIKIWTEENIGTTLFAKRKLLLSGG
jgi:hypothetical protein